MIDIATTIIAVEEGYEPKVYTCTEGYPTVGIGLKVGYKGQDLTEFREFPDMPFEVATLWAQDSINAIPSQIANYPLMNGAYMNCSPVRQAVIVSMCYQLGMQGASQFKRTWSAILSNDFDTAAKEMVDSRWYRQTPQRVTRAANMMSTNILPSYYGE
jgi:lysozyme